MKKNLKFFALAALFLTASSNAFAAVGDLVYKDNLAYTITKEATATAAAEVQFLGLVADPVAKDGDGTAIANQNKTITIPATISTNDAKGNKINYTVTSIASDWATYSTGTDVTSTLETLVVNVYDKTFTATNCVKLASVTLPTTQVELAADAFKGDKVLATIDISKVKTIGASAFEGCAALTSVDLTAAETVGASAFKGTNITSLTIPNTLKTIGANAFANIYTAAYTDDKGVEHAATGLQTLEFNAYSDATKGFTEIPAVFSGDKLLKNIKIVSTKATKIAANTFESTVIETIDLSEATALTEIEADAFGASTNLTSVKLKGTKLTSISNLNISGSNRTLAEITLPATLESLDANKFQNAIALTALDLSETKVTVIPNNLVAYNEVPATQALNDDGTGKVDADGNPVYIAPVLASVKLNAETKSVGNNAFYQQKALATVEGLNQAKLESIGTGAFYKTALTTLDLSAATNAKFTAIGARTFAEIPTLTSIKLPAQISSIAEGAFAWDAKVASINLEDLEELTVLNAIFHYGKADAGDKNEVAIALKSITLPENLETIKEGALQLLDIEEIVIPSSVQRIENAALQGCINLKKFTWNDGEQYWIANNTFWGDDKLEEVNLVTRTARINITTAITPYSGESVDFIFKGNKPETLTVTVNAEVYDYLIAQGWTEANLKYCTLVGEGETEFAFKAAGKSGDYYYATYYSDKQATWFSADEFEVFSAVVDGSNVVLQPASVEEGYYKVAKYTGNPKTSVAVIRSKNQTANIELKNATFNNISTLPTDNGLKVVDDADGLTASRLKFQYQLGVKDGVVAFYRINSGTIAEGKVYIDASSPKARLDIVFDGEATAIDAVETVAEDAPIYNLQGVRVNNAQKGIYIQNGKKFVK